MPQAGVSVLLLQNLSLVNLKPQPHDHHLRLPSDTWKVLGTWVDSTPALLQAWCPWPLSAEPPNTPPSSPPLLNFILSFPCHLRLFHLLFCSLQIHIFPDFPLDLPPLCLSSWSVVPHVYLPTISTWFVASPQSLYSENRLFSSYKLMLHPASTLCYHSFHDL